MSPSESIKFLHPEAEGIAKNYIGTTAPLEVIGCGVGGAVFISPKSYNAVKVHGRQETFAIEAAAYRRLTQQKVFEIQGLEIPKLIKISANHRLIEMSIVRIPYLLDFAGVLMDKMDFTQDAMDSHWKRMEAIFDSRFSQILSIYHELVRRTRIHYFDFKPRNIEFGDLPIE